MNSCLPFSRTENDAGNTGYRLSTVRPYILSLQLTEIPQSVPVITKPQPDHDPLHHRYAQESPTSSPLANQPVDSMRLTTTNYHSHERIHPDGRD
jgi:hypothetical protein